MINLKASRKTPTINISANPVTNVHVTNRGTEMAAHPYGAADGATMVQYPPPNEQPMGMPNGEFVSVNPATINISEFQSDDPEKSKLLRENAVLKLIIDIQHSNPLIVNKYIIADDATLIKLVQLLCNIHHPSNQSVYQTGKLRTSLLPSRARRKSLYL